MRFLFIGPGFPGLKGAGSGSGIGTYLSELTCGLTQKGHECHVIVWGEKTVDSRLKTVGDIQNPIPKQPDNSTTQQPLHKDVGSVKVWLLPHSYWPGIERIMPDSRDVWNLRQMAKRLDVEYHYDWIEIESEEGIGIGVQRDFPDKTILRAHTTLLQMVEYKGAGKARNFDGDRQDAQNKELVGSFCQNWKLHYRLRRERRSFAMARRITVSSIAHAKELKRLYTGIVEPAIVHLGVSVDQSTEQRCDLITQTPSFLIVGTADRRKGFDRILPVLAEYAAKYGPCRAVIVADSDEKTRAELGLDLTRILATAPVQPIDVLASSRIMRSTCDVVTGVLAGSANEDAIGDSGYYSIQYSEDKRIGIVWKRKLSREQLASEYQKATVYLHLARYESFGLPLIEAAAHQVPLVSTPVGIAPELMCGELANGLAKGDDSAGVAAALYWAVKNKISAGRQVYERYIEGFTNTGMTLKFLKSL